MNKILLTLAVLIGFQTINAQEANRVITTGVPFLLIAADARSAALGDMGVATSADTFSQQYNPSKYAFATQEHGFSVSYTPYLTSIANDIALGQLTYYNRFNERSAFAGSLRYFSLGEIQLADNTGVQTNVVKPGEFAIDGSYSLKLSDEFAMGIAGRYIRSNLRFPTQGQNNTTNAATSFAVDVSGYYQSEEIAYSDFNGKWRAGFNFQNLGPKINYELGKSDAGSNYLPTNLRLGGGFDFILDEYNKVGITAEFTKLLVPTPPSQVTPVDSNNNGAIDQSEKDDATSAYQNSVIDYRGTNWVSGMFKSFGDAPGGTKEELQEVTYAVGAEYWYQDSFALRTGYFHESEVKGARKFFTLGAGFKYNIVKIDVSYLFSASKVRNPLENTLRFSLSFNFGDKYDEY